MDKSLHILFAVLFCMFACGPVALYCATHCAGAELPTWFTAVDASYLSGDTQEADIRANLTPRGVVEKRFQSAVETEVGNSIPMKARAMLGNAALQREFVRVANTPFAYDTYPTYYGSNKYCWPRERMVLEAPRAEAVAFNDSAARLVAACATLVKRHPEVNWVYYLADRSGTTSYSPIAKYRSDACDISFYESRVRDALPDSCLFLSGRYGNEREFADLSMETDHHWNIRGAVRAYEA